MARPNIKPSLSIIVLLLTSVAIVHGDEEDRDRAYRSLSDEDRQAIDQQEPNRRTRILDNVAAQIRRRQEQPATQPTDWDALDKRAATRPLTTKPAVDEPLLEAWSYYLQETNRDRDRAVALFLNYIEANPDSPLLAELYYRIGTLYSTNRGENDPYEPKLMVKHFEIAKQLHGEKMSYEGIAARGSLANQPGREIGDVLAYYEWLRKMKQSATVDDVWPFVGIGQYLKGRRHQRDASELQLSVENFKENLDPIIQSTERNILARNSMQRNTLIDLANAYPDTALGINARMQASKLARSGSGDDVGPAAPIVPSAASETSRPSATAVREGVTADTRTSKFARMFNPAIVTIVAVCVAFAMGLYLKRKRSGEPATRGAKGE